MSMAPTPPATDWTVQMFDRVFGSGWGTFFSNGSGSATGSLLGSLALSFNGLLLAVLALLVGYHFIIAASESAHSGIPMGRRYHSFWMPVRSATAFITLGPLPMFKGLCLLQLIVLSASYYGIGIADSLWQDTTAYLAQNSGQVSVVLDHPDTNLATSVLKLVVLQNYLARKTVGGQALTPQVITDPGQSNSQQFVGQLIHDIVLMPGTTSPPVGEIKNVIFPVRFTMGTGSMEISRDFGYVQIRCPGGSIANYCDSEAQAVVRMAVTLQPLATAILNSTGVYGSSGSAPGEPTAVSTNLAGVFGTAVIQYQSELQQAVVQDTPTFNSKLATDLNQWSQVANVQGWASAGSWFFQMNTVSSSVQSQLDIPPAVISPSPTWIMSHFVEYDFGDVTQAVDRYLRLYDPTYASLATSQTPEGDITPSDTAIQTSPSNTFSGFEQSTQNWIQSGYDAARSWWNNNVTLALINKVIQTMAGNTMFGDKTTDPITELVSLGHGLIDAGYVLIVPPPTRSLGKALMGYGMVLAFFVPAYPYLIWFLAVLGWFILCLEVFIAAPLWALSHMEAQGEGFAGVRARQGYMMVFGLLLRPALMVFAFILTLTILKVAFWLFANGMSVFMSALESNYVAGPLTLIAMLTIVVFTAAAVLYKVAGIPAWLPNHVLDFLGQFIQPLDAHSDTQRIYGAVLGRSSIASAASRNLQHAAHQAERSLTHGPGDLDSPPSSPSSSPGVTDTAESQAGSDLNQATQTAGQTGPAGETASVGDVPTNRGSEDTGGGPSPTKAPDDPASGGSSGGGAPPSSSSPSGDAAASAGEAAETIGVAAL